MLMVKVYGEYTLKEFYLPVSEVEAFIRLVRKYGFQDDEGIDYTFTRAQVDADGSLTIYVDDEK
jgi:hypothetical protein